MSFFNNIGTSFQEVKPNDFAVPYPGGTPRVYKLDPEIPLHMNFYGKDYVFKYVRKTYLASWRDYCQECIFYNPRYNDRIARCRLRASCSNDAINRCTTQLQGYFTNF